MTATTVLVVRWTCTDLGAGVASGALSSFETLLPALASVALLGCAGWGWVVGSLVVLAALRDHGRRGVGVPRGVPAWARRAVLAACGVTLVGTTPLVPAHAATEVDAAGRAAREAVHVVAGLPLPDRTTGPLDLGHLDAVSRLAAAATAAAARGETVTVRPGDSLWSIAEHLLGPGADAAVVADAVRRLHDANRAVIGPDPDLILPGRQLRTPLHQRPSR
jgi:hypothetical protein